MYKNGIFLTIVMLVLLQVSGSTSFRSATDSYVGDGSNGAKGGALIAEIGGPPGWTHIFGLAYHDDYNMLYASRGGTTSNNALAYGSYEGGSTVTWVEFDNVDYVCGLGCYQDDQLYAVTQSIPGSGDPYYLYTWQLDGSGIPTGAPDVYELTSLATGGMGGCEWDGDYLWMLDQNFVADGDPIVYKYDVTTHSVIASWSCIDVGGFGIACVWDQGDLNIWVSYWYGGNKLMEYSDLGSSTGLHYGILASPNDIAYKYDTDFDGPGFFVGCYGSNQINLYDHCLSSLEQSSWGAIKADFTE
ncbi:MAG: hypothetical protein K8S24_09905 [Candidatus Aegiribacteria sp.]|nr:hypothetical protein [Candidatus Aegiribacteria sp.]